MSNVEPSNSSAIAVRRCCFGIISDAHVALPHTIWRSPNRLHQMEVGIPALEQVFEHLQGANIDFLLMPGDLTQHGEPENHHWLGNRLARLPFPTYVIPGNHDFPARTFYKSKISQEEFVDIYRKFGFQGSGSRPYYNRKIFPGIRLIGLNSNQLSADGQHIDGKIDLPQMEWLNQQLNEYQANQESNPNSDEILMVMVHHNVAEHIPNQSTHPLGQRYILPGAVMLQKKLRDAGVKVVFTGHLHVQNITDADGLFAITTGSLISYPHPYRILTLYEIGSRESPHKARVLGDRPQPNTPKRWLEIQTHTVKALPNWDNLTAVSRQWAGDHSEAFMTQLLAKSSLNLSLEDAEHYSQEIRYLWADTARGDQQLSFPSLPPKIRIYCEAFGVRSHNNQLRFSDNNIALRID